ncbi:hypothetical protein SAMN02746089_00304 [Caldanaerobius fijiensis DSM 17918]|uniref:TGF-beta propeptide n=1 Tax=Caldanaerobius fijiensis DSM 17918 TaxID=1121256 RepID=A0A1M4TUD0_9THEO|nr:DNRLRE domain-containing protein [Caldanaerobius fijiensis]SHE48062.1 hypothetical protein SAMN02746089_00304 [Caldanaerobius fijiensis DSM 17918]
MPTLIIPSSSKDAQINSRYPNENYGTLNYMNVGRYDNYTVFMALVQFDISSIPAGVSITNAVMTLNVISIYNTNIIDVVTPYRVTQDWDEYTVNWSNAPIVDDHTFGSSVNLFSINKYSWDVTNLVKGWYIGLYPNYGMMLKSLQTRNYEAKVIATREYEDISKRPSLIITYEATNLFTLYSRLKNSESQTVNTTDSYMGGNVYDTSEMSMYSFFVKNNGVNPAEVKLQISPNGEDWLDDSEPIVVAPGDIKAIVPYLYAHFSRLSYKSFNFGRNTNITIWYQAHV